MTKDKEWLRDRYSKEWVILRDGLVILHGKDAVQLCSEARKRFGFEPSGSELILVD